VRKAFKYRLYPTAQQEQALAEMLETHRHLYNRALAERKTAWDERQESVSYGQQSAHLKDERTTNPYLARTNFSSCQATLRRLDRAFQAFFRRLKAGEAPGYPRFKGANRFDTVEFPGVPRLWGRLQVGGGAGLLPACRSRQDQGASAC
jgi:putative transposase